MARALAYALGVVAIGVLGYLLLASGGDEQTGPVAVVEPEPPLCDQNNPVDPHELSLPRPPATPPPGELTAIVRTSCGRFEIALDSDDAPRTVASFVHLSRKGAYDDTGFHRIVPGELIEGGDPAATGDGGPGYAVSEPVPADIRYRRRDVLMSSPRVDVPGLSGSVFFIVLSRDVVLPPQFARLGRVEGGFGTVRKIESLADPEGVTEEPIVPVHIDGVAIRRR